MTEDQLRHRLSGSKTHDLNLVNAYLTSSVIRWISEWQEFRIRFQCGGPDSDYFTDNLDDAIGTALHWERTAGSPIKPTHVIFTTKGDFN